MIQLRYIKRGDKFSFVDEPGASYEYVTVCEGTTPKLKNLETGEEKIYPSNTYYRNVELIN